MPVISSPIELSRFQFDQNIENFIQDVLQDKDKEKSGFLTLDTRHSVEYMDKGLVDNYLREKMYHFALRLKGVETIIVDGNATHIKDGKGKYLVRATSLEAEEKLVIGKNVGSSLEVYERDGNQLKIVASVHVRWGSSIRAVISDGKLTQDYILMDKGNIAEVVKADQKTNVMDINAKTKDNIVSIGEDSPRRPLFMKDFDQEIMPTIKHKGRYAGAITADMYKILSEGIFMATWMTYGEAFGKAQAVQGAHGFTKVMTKDGLKNVLDLKLTEEMIESDKQIYVYIGTEEIMQALQEFLDAAPPLHYTSGDLERTKPLKNAQLITIPKKETFTQYFNEEVTIPNTMGMDQDELATVQSQLYNLVNGFREAFVNPIQVYELDDQQAEIIAALREDAPEAFYKVDDKEHIHSLKWLMRNIMEPESDSSEEGMNPSGDVAKKLDRIFNAVLIYLLRPQVHAIVSEEEKFVVYGVHETKDTREGYRIVIFLDPLDGSSAILTGESFGTIITFGVEVPGQNIGDADFDSRKQLLSKIEVRYGPSINLSFLNPQNPKGKAEVEIGRAHV